MLQGILIVISIDVVLELYEMVFGYFKWDTGYITVVAMIALIGYLGYYGINQSKILLPHFLLKDMETREDNGGKEKVTFTINFTKDEITLLTNKIKTVLKDEKPYLDEDLTLNKLALMLETTDKKLSTFLNQHLHTNFYDLINKERVAAVKEKMDSAHFNKYTLLGIAYESGFKSKTSFNRIFKKETGLSPSEYRKQHK